MIRFFFLFSTLCLSASVGLVIPTTTPTAHQRATHSRLFVSSIPTHQEQDARWSILSRAKQCAYGDEEECSIEYAKELWTEMLHLQSGCAAGGTLVGQDICEEQDVAADVVAHLREKAQGGGTTTKHR
jgi:hypothetical protein